MKRAIGLWCIYCDNLGESQNDNGRRCIQCLRDTILNLQDEIDKPINYKERV